MAVCTNRWVPSVFAPSIAGVSVRSTRPRAPGPTNATLRQLSPGSGISRSSDVSTAITMNRLPAPSAVTADMLPLSPGGSAKPVANLPQSGGSNVTPGGSVCGVSSRGSMPVGATVLTLNSGANIDFTSASLEMSLWTTAGVGAPEHAASTRAQAANASLANEVLDIAANLPAPHCRHGLREQPRGEVGPERGVRRAGIGHHGHVGDVPIEVGAKVSAREWVSVPPSTTVVASVTMPTVGTPSMVGGATNVTSPLV